MIQHTTAKFSYRVGYIRGAKVIRGKIVGGRRRWVTPWKHNLILDSGLNMVASTVWADCFKSCLFGNQVSPDPVSRNGGATTFSQTGTAITASGSFFVAQDTGRLFKFDSGEECYLTFVNSTTATASISRTVGSGFGTVWYVNQTALQSLYQATSSYDSTGGANGTTYAGATATMKRTFVGTAVVGSATLTEIGFSSSNSNSNIFDRDIITGGFSLINGDIPLAVATLNLTLGPITPTAVGNVTTGFDSSGQFMVVSINQPGGTPWIPYVASNGGTQGSVSPILEPSSAGSHQLSSTSPTFPTFTWGFNTVTGWTPSGTATQALQAYTNGSFFRETISNWSISQGNGPVYAIGNGANGGGMGWMLKFTTPFTKLSTQVLQNITTRKSWQRILVN